MDDMQKKKSPAAAVKRIFGKKWCVFCWCF